MITRILDVTLTLTVGLAAGYLVAGYSGNERGIPPATVSYTGETAARPSIDPAVSNTVEGSVDDCRPEYTSDPAPSTDTTMPLPEVYLDVIGPLTPRRSGPEAYDYFAAFARELRDEPWAAAMEAGISSWVDEKRHVTGTTVDFAECRASVCVVAGHSTTGDTSLLDRIQYEGWWLASGPSMDMVVSGRDGSADFVKIYNRYAALTIDNDPDGRE